MEGQAVPIAKKLTLNAEQLLQEIAHYVDIEEQKLIWATEMQKGEPNRLFSLVNTCLNLRLHINECLPRELEELCWKDCAIALLHNQEPTIQSFLYTRFINAGYPIPLAYRVPGRDKLHINDNALQFVLDYSNNQPLVFMSLFEDISSAIHQLLNVPENVIPTSGNYVTSYADIYVPPMNYETNYNQVIIVAELAQEDRETWLSWLTAHKTECSHIVVLADHKTTRIDAEINYLKEHGFLPQLLKEKLTSRVSVTKWTFEANGTLRTVEKSQSHQLLPSNLPQAPLELKGYRIMHQKLHEYSEGMTFAKFANALMENQMNARSIQEKFRETLVKLQRIIGEDSSWLHLVMCYDYLLHCPQSSKTPRLHYLLIEELVSLGFVATSLNISQPWCMNVITQLFVLGYPLPIVQGPGFALYSRFLNQVFENVSTEYLHNSLVGLITIFGASMSHAKSNSLNSTFGTKFTAVGTQSWPVSASLVRHTNTSLLIINIEGPSLSSSSNPEDLWMLQSCSLFSNIFVFYLVMEAVTSQVDNFVHKIQAIQDEQFQKGHKNKPLFSVMFIHDVQDWASTQASQIHEWACECPYPFDKYWDYLNAPQITLNLSVANCPLYPVYIRQSSELCGLKQLLQAVQDSRRSQHTLPQIFRECVNIHLLPDDKLEPIVQTTRLTLSQPMASKGGHSKQPSNKEIRIGQRNNVHEDKKGTNYSQQGLRYAQKAENKKQNRPAQPRKSLKLEPTQKDLQLRLQPAPRRQQPPQSKEKLQQSTVHNKKAVNLQYPEANAQNPGPIPAQRNIPTVQLDFSNATYSKPEDRKDNASNKKLMNDSNNSNHTSRETSKQNAIPSTTPLYLRSMGIDGKKLLVEHVQLSQKIKKKNQILNANQVKELPKKTAFAQRLQSTKPGSCKGKFDNVHFAPSTAKQTTPIKISIDLSDTSSRKVQTDPRPTQMPSSEKRLKQGTSTSAPVSTKKRASSRAPPGTHSALHPKVFPAQSTGTKRCVNKQPSGNHRNTTNNKIGTNAAKAHK